MSLESTEPALTYESVACLLCGSDDARPILKRPSPRHVICRKCGLVYQNPRPTAESMAEHYRQGYWEARIANGPNDDRPFDVIFVERGRAALSMLGRPLTADDVVVEIGCGHGEVIETIRRIAPPQCQCIGVEPSLVQADLTRQRFGLEVVTGDARTADLGGRLATVLVLSHVAEHFYDPVAELAACRRLLADDGLLFVEVPNIMDPASTKSLSAWLVFEHVNYFSAQSLSVVLKRAGFTPVTVSDRNALRVAAKKSESAPDYAPPRNEFWRVKRRLALHELVYWPRRAAQKLRSGSKREHAAEVVER